MFYTIKYNSEYPGQGKASYAYPDIKKARAELHKVLTLKYGPHEGRIFEYREFDLKHGKLMGIGVKTPFGPDDKPSPFMAIYPDSKMYVVYENKASTASIKPRYYLNKDGSFGKKVRRN